MALARFSATLPVVSIALASGLSLGYLTPLQAQEVVEVSVAALLAQTPPPQPGVAQPAPAPDPQSISEPGDYRPLTQDSSVLSIQGGIRMMRDANAAISNQDYNTAQEKLQDARRVFNQLTNFYQELSATFVGINTPISEAHRLRAVETAQMRDEASYQLALVHRAQNDPELAVPLLIQIITSQNPASDLGEKAYEQLFELGFVDTPFSWEGAGSNP